MKSDALKHIVVLFTIFVLAGCKGGEIYPIIPFITFEKITQYSDSNGSPQIDLSVKFTDGDGDIGLAEQDTFPPFNSVIGPTHTNINLYYYNFYMEYMRKEGGVFKNVINDMTGDTIRENLRVMPLTPEGKYKAIRGVINVQFEPAVFLQDGDTVKVKIQLIDRKLHLSNTTESTEIVIKR